MAEQPGRYIGEQPQQPLPQQEPSKQPPPNLLNQIIQEERVSNFLSQTSPVTTLQNLNYILKGFIYDDATKEWVKVAEGIPEDIRLDFLQFITPDLSDDVRMTNLNINQINGLMEMYIEWIVDYLDLKADEEDSTLKEEQMSKIMIIMLKAIFYTLLRSQGGMESARIFKSLSLGEEMSPNIPSQSQKPWWQIWK